jgi:uncharacterized repeat protein (TIGR01451 family)
LLVAALTLGLAGLIKAATTVDLGAADDFAVLAGAGITNTGSTTITGDVGTYPTLTESGFGSIALSGTDHVGDAVTQQAKDDLVLAYDDAAGQGSAIPIIADLGGQTLAPGVYSSGSSIGLTGTLTLDGGGDPDAVFIFQAGSTLTTASGSAVNLINGAQACHVFWQVGSSATLGTNSTFKGNILALTSATLTTGVNVEGRVLARNGAVTLDANTITKATCAAPPAPATLHVIKHVVNDNTGTKDASDFSLHVKRSGTDVGGSPANGAEDPGISYSLAAGTYVVSEDAISGYSAIITGACDVNGNITLVPGDDLTCTIINNDNASRSSGLGGYIVPPVPPLIDVVKVPSPLALPDGSGLVTYTYTLRNIGTVPVTDVTMADDVCSSITFVSGDVNADTKLDVNETWIYRCSMTLSETRTNTVVATGWANGLSATDIASATVVVGESVVPPLIHVTKLPSPQTLLAGGGTVTYTETITNPGTVALSNIRLTDDKCSPVKYLSGDTNGDSKLDVAESWIYTCQSNLTKTTTNTATAEGVANGLTVRDFAIATILVADVAPALPNTGLDSPGKSVPWDMVILAGFTLVLVLLVAVLRKRAI